MSDYDLADLRERAANDDRDAADILADLTDGADDAG
ncbi:hypothetical protein SAMN04489832_1036 [Micromonospora cremea]|uniref:Uncharacterized protein n=1 Tax=Micromonospora cremea TaxID=709881 RepID=A0A1N5UMP6_9ACTN|nr:hypothetical protein SAMN04489832_1036 [Micromonospora cremea]